MSERTSAMTSVTVAAMIWSWSLGLSTAPDLVVRIGVPLTAAVGAAACASAALRYRSQFWTALTGAITATFLQHVVWAARPDVAPDSRIVGGDTTVVFMGIATVFGGVALWVGARHLLSYRPLRPLVLVSVAVATGAISVTVVTVGMIRRDGSPESVVASVVLAGVFTAAELVAVSMASVRLIRIGRIGEPLCIVAGAMLTAMSLVWSAAGFTSTWYLPVLLPIGLLAAAALHPAAGQIGRPVEAHPVVTRVPVGASITVTVASASLAALLVLDAPGWALWPSSAIAVVSGFLAVWRVGGGAFDLRRSFDRDVHDLPGQLVRGITVGYVPVLRLDDSTVVGGRAVPLWRSDAGDLARVRRAAAAADLSLEVDLHLAEQVGRTFAPLRSGLPPDWVVVVPVQLSSVVEPRFRQQLVSRLLPLAHDLEGLAFELDRPPATPDEVEALAAIRALGGGCVLPLPDDLTEPLPVATAYWVDLGGSVPARRAQISEAVRRVGDRGRHTMAIGVDQRHAHLLAASVRVDRATGDAISAPVSLDRLLARVHELAPD